MYEGKSRDEAIDSGIYPNTAMEENFTEQLQYFHFVKTTNKNEYVIESIDHGLSFILNDMESLKEIATVYVSDSIKKLKPIAYDPTSNSYVTLGDVVGKAFSDGLKLK